MELPVATVVRISIFVLVLAALGFGGWFIVIRMPGKSYRAPLPPLGKEEAALRDALQRDVSKLADEIGERNLWRYGSLVAAAEFVEASFSQAGYQVRRQEYQVEGRPCHNIEVELSPANQSEEIVIIGAHYDSILGSPGANDNATGTASVLALARAFAGKAVLRNLRFVMFVNEEPPLFQTDAMGSLVYARRCRQRGEKVVTMLSLETMGYYSDAAGTQSYPGLLGFFYPSTADFISFVGNIASRRVTREVVASFRTHARFPSEGGAFPDVIPGVGWSDHWAFWQQGYPGVMVTDTALFRYPQYHSQDDTPDKVNYERLARVVASLERVVWDLVQKRLARDPA